MKFVDQATITVTAGKGGDGIVSFRREKYIPRGGPDGGNGGKGGDIILVGDHSLNTLSKFRYQRIFKAENGRPGEGKNKTGMSGSHLLIPIPLGTQVYDDETNYLIGEILYDNENLLVAKGGQAGVGNTMFKSSTNQAPRQFTKGETGDKYSLRLDLSVLADIGLLGMPNAGKSSLLRKISQAKPKVSDYPFTTLYPNLGVVSPYPDVSFVVADIPGIIEGAHIGTGLGLQFLRHISRTKMLLHVVDCLPVDQSDPLTNIKIVNKEISRYGDLHHKKQWLLINKCDLLLPKDLQKLKSKIEKNIKPSKLFTASCLNGQGLEHLLKELTDFFTDESF